MLEHKVIIDELNWTPITIETEITRTVCQIYNSRGERCNGVKTNGLILTAEHCATRRVTADFGDSLHKCKRINSHPYWDYAWYKCKDIESYPDAVFSPEYSTQAIEIIHYNCNFKANPFCKIKKLKSPGKILSEANRLTHDADTLAGSSGAPIFSEGKLIGIHTSGLEDEYNVGTWVGVIDEFGQDD